MTDTEITGVAARRIWDSRGHPTVEVDVTLACGATGRGVAPAGASRGTREAVDLRDGGTHLGGKDVSRALDGIRTVIAPSLTGQDAADQAAIDAALLALDPSPLKARLGGNAVVATSLAVLSATAAAHGKPLWRHVADIEGTEPLLPLPEVQIFGGGAHAGRRVDIQDFMIVVPGAEDFDAVMETTSAIYFAARDIMADRGALSGVADEGGWWPQFDSNEQALETLVEAIERAGEVPGDRVAIALDVAASEFGRAGRYRLALDDRDMDSDGLIELLGRWIDRFPIISIEDPLAEDDTAGMQAFTRAFGDRVQIVGDDYLVTDATLTEQAVADRACNAVLIKVNQVGTVSQAFETARAARKAGWGAIVSARSGETEDVAISHLATGLGMGQLKVGSFSRSERMAKWNECLRIGERVTDFAAGRPYARTWWSRDKEDPKP